MKLETPMRLERGMNAREHHFARHRRVKKEKAAIGWLLTQFERPTTPVTFVITRVAPGSGLDPADNLPSACKNVIDAIATWMGIDDSRADLVSYRFKNERGAWALRIETAS